MENTLFVLSALNVECQQTSEHRLSMGSSLYFSNIERAESAMKNYRQSYASFYDDAAFETQLFCLILDEYELDHLHPRKISSRVFRPDLEEGQRMALCEPDPARDCRPGDVVEVALGDCLYTSIVSACPSSTSLQDCYEVLVYPEMEKEYVASPWLFKPLFPVRAEVLAALRQALALTKAQCECECECE